MTSYGFVLFDATGAAFGHDFTQHQAENILKALERNRRYYKETYYGLRTSS